MSEEQVMLRVEVARAQRVFVRVLGAIEGRGFGVESVETGMWRPDGAVDMLIGVRGDAARVRTLLAQLENLIDVLSARALFDAGFDLVVAVADDEPVQHHCVDARRGAGGDP